MGRFYDQIKDELDALESKGGHSSFGADYDSNTTIVSQVQTAINRAGYSPALTVDGAYGPMTKAGIEWLQGQKGLSVDGIIGDQTLTALGIKSPSGGTSSAGGTAGAAAPVNWARAYATAAAALRQAAQKHGFPTPSDQLLRWMIGQVMSESNLGMASTVAGTNNWGAYQATPSWLQSHASEPGYGAVAYHDTSPPSTDYIGFLRVYPSQAAAADDWFARWGTILMTGGEPSSVTDYATRLYQHGYFEGFHAGARPVGQRTLPLTDPEQQNVNDYAKFMGRSIDISGPADDPNKIAYVGRPQPIATRLTPKYGTALQTMINNLMAGQWGALASGIDFLTGDGIIWADGKAPPEWLGPSANKALALLSKYTPSPNAIIASVKAHPYRTGGIVAAIIAAIAGFWWMLIPKSGGGTP